MKKTWMWGVGVLAVAALAVAPVALAKKRLAFGGGPTGGTFEHFSNAFAILLSKNIDGVEVSSEGSGGSAENLKRLNNGDVDFGIVYSVDLWLGAKGQLPEDPKEYTKVRPMSYLFGAPAQLVVRKDSGITEPTQLAGKKVAVGPAGSGAALSARRYFEGLGLWDKIEPQFIGYSAAVPALGDKKVDGMWVLAGFPNASITEAATTADVLILSVGKADTAAPFYAKFPAYSPVKIPAGTYKGQDKDVETFQDSALWCSRDKVDADTIYKALKVVYSAEGLEHMVKAHKAASAMSVASGLQGVPLPLHKGADKFWTEQGAKIPDGVKAKD